MTTKTRRFATCSAVLFIAVLASGCIGKVSRMQLVPADRVVTGPAEGKAMVVFLRATAFGGAIQSAVFEMNNGEPSLVGIVAAYKKVAYQVDPGKHLFMVTGENADFMSADLEANKTYYALVTVRMGAWKARFSLKPIPAAEGRSSKLNGWLKKCKWVEKIPASDAWMHDNMPSIRNKYNVYYEKWMAKSASRRPAMLPRDGRYTRRRRLATIDITFYRRSFNETNSRLNR